MSTKNTEPLTRICGEGHVAARYGLEEAIFLDSIIYWWRTNRDNNRNFKDGRWWTYNTLKTYTNRFPWWTCAQIRRIIARCKDKGALLTANYNEDQRDRTLWYSPSDELLMLYGEISAPCNCPKEQMESGECAQSCDGNSTALPCNYHDSTIPPYSPPAGGRAAADGDSLEPPLTDVATQPEQKPKARRRRGAKAAADWEPEMFGAFWDSYPRKDGKQEAIAAWDKLRPDKETMHAMGMGLKAAKQSRKWTKDNGEYIEYASTWINNRRWENQGIDLSKLPRSGGWAEDRGRYD